MQKRDRGDDTVSDHGDRSLRSCTGEAALEAAGIGAGGESTSAEGDGLLGGKRTQRNICDTTAVKRKKQFERERMVEKRQRTSEKRRKDSHKYRGIPKNPKITVAQNAGEFKKKQEIVLRRKKRLGRIL